MINRTRVGLVQRSWRDSGISEDLPGDVRLPVAAAATAPAAAGASATAHLALPPLPAAQQALMASAPPAKQPAAAPRAAAAPDIETIVREAIEEVIAR